MLTLLKGVHLVDLSGATINVRAEDDTPFFSQGSSVLHNKRAQNYKSLLYMYHAIPLSIGFMREKAVDEASSTVDV